jgi:hypothetical protein
LHACLCGSALDEYSATKIGGHALDHLKARSHAGEHQQQSNLTAAARTRDVDLWSFDPLRRFGGMSVPLLSMLMSTGNGSSDTTVANSNSKLNSLANERDEELAAYSKYMRAFISTSNNSSANRQQQQQQQQHRLKLTVPQIAQLPQHAAAVVMLPSRPPSYTATDAHISIADNSSNAALPYDDTPRHSPDMSTVRAASIGGAGGAASVIALSRLKDKLTANNSNSTNSVSIDSNSSSAISMNNDRSGAWSWSERLKLVPSYSKLRKYSYIQQIGTGNHGNVILVKQVRS